MRYGSVCSGVEAATLAWHELDWKAQWFSEVEPFPSAVLAHNWPEIPNLGDMTKHKEWTDVGAIDLLVGGTPCQSFSVAGLRKGLADPRGNLALVYLAIAEQFRPRWLAWENVPGVLSSNGGRDFGSFLGALGKLGYGWAYRVLDAQYFGVAQRRRRVFVVGHLGDWRRAAAVLFERESMSGNPAPSREARQSVAGTLSARTSGGGGFGTDFELSGGLIPEVSLCLTKGVMQRLDSETETMIPVAHSLRDEVRIMRVAGALAAKPGAKQQTYGQIGMAVRRLMPVECERLQGFPDDYTLIPWRGKPVEQCPDGPRYKAIGNSMAVPVMRWIGNRIEMVEGVLNQGVEATA